MPINKTIIKGKKPKKIAKIDIKRKKGKYILTAKVDKAVKEALGLDDNMIGHSAKWDCQFYRDHNGYVYRVRDAFNSAMSYLNKPYRVDTDQIGFQMFNRSSANASWIRCVDLYTEKGLKLVLSDEVATKEEIVRWVKSCSNFIRWIQMNLVRDLEVKVEVTE